VIAVFRDAAPLFARALLLSSEAEANMPALMRGFLVRRGAASPASNFARGGDGDGDDHRDGGPDIAGLRRTRKP
jgi:hypothetical protein